MKQLVVMLGCIMLGVYLFGLILGADPNTLQSKQKEVFQYQLDQYEHTY